MNRKELNLRQHRWLELLKDYDLVIDYHPSKVNVVVYTLSRKFLFALRAMNAQLTMRYDGFILTKLRAKSLFLQRIQELQKDDSKLQTK